MAAEGGTPGDVAGVAAVQEEVGDFAGSRTAAFELRPDVAVAVDVAHATDVRGSDAEEEGEHKLGGGPVLMRGPSIHPQVFELLYETAEQEGIPVSLEVSRGHTNTDADAVHLSRAGVATGLVSIPVRYMHTPVETVQLDDVEAVVRLLVAFARRLEPGLSFDALMRTVVVAAVRTPFGRLGGGLAKLPATELGSIAVRAALERAGLEGGEVDYVIMGQVLQGGAGQAPARQAAVGAGIPIEVPSDTINKVCASSIRAVEIADSMIRAGDAEVVVTGGMESMSNAPYILEQARFGYRLGDGTLIDLMTHDGLTSSFDGLHMVQQASFVARELGLSREDQDRWALRSQERAAAAQDAGRLDDELVPVGDLAADESVRRDSSYEKLASLKPVFDPEGTTTAGNAPGVNDGASCLVVCSDEFARRRGLEPLATVVAQGYVADEFAYLARTPAKAGGGRARAGGQDDRRREAGRGERGVRVCGRQLRAAARRRPGDGERERRRDRARASDRRERRPHPRHDGARAPPRGRRARPRRDLLRRRPGRRALARGLGTSSHAAAVLQTCFDACSCSPSPRSPPRRLRSPTARCRTRCRTRRASSARTARSATSP